ncbi:MAG: hypothetical protein WC554_09735 [Clostridia bacterium]
MNKVLIILRGCPGSGKNSFAELFGNKDIICCADDYHMRDGKYDWKPENMRLSHLKCQNKCVTLMKENKPLIIIANTSTTKKELKPYYDLAIGYNYKIFSVIIENRHNGKNIHNVPEETIKKMKERFDISL